VSGSFVAGSAADTDAGACACACACAGADSGSGAGAVAGPLTASFGAGKGPGSDDIGATASGVWACETVGVIEPGSGLGETMDDSIDGCRSEVVVGAEIGVESDVETFGL
jgi:hypothetical protein